MEERVFDTKEVAEILKISNSHAYQLMHSDKLETFDISLGGKRTSLRITESNLKKFMEGEND